MAGPAPSARFPILLLAFVFAELSTTAGIVFGFPGFQQAIRSRNGQAAQATP